MINRVSTRTALVLICAAALAHAAIYIVHQRPDWETGWSDQGGYKQLGAGLAIAGEFTRTPGAAVYAPEPIRTPGYPAFVAVIYKLFGIHNHMAVAIAQAFVFMAICLLVFVIVRRVADDRIALLGAAMTAAFSPLPYFGALVLTELWTAFLMTAMMAVTLLARERRGYGLAVAAGALAAAVALTRPVFYLAPFGLFPLIVLLDRFAGWRKWALAMATAAICIAPWFAYNYVYFDRITISPANGLGRAFWEASWQGVWNGRLQDELTETAGQPIDDAALDVEVRKLAAQHGQDAGPMIEYVHQWRDIRGLWADPQDRIKWAASRIVADAEFYRVGIANARRDLGDHIRRRFTRALPVLWIGEIPWRHSAINQLPVIAIRIMWAVQAALILLAAIAVTAALRGPRWREALIVAFPFAYITAVHAALLTESRQSLPGMPSVIALSAVGLAVIVGLRTNRQSQKVARDL
jgi:4-amino-4-deoxy-L-arabinose transferase-like glycosyltransferase